MGFFLYLVDPSTVGTYNALLTYVPNWYLHHKLIVKTKLNETKVFVLHIVIGFCYLETLIFCEVWAV